MNLQTMTKVELQSLAYEQLVIIEQSQNNLKIINQEIQQRNQNPVTEHKKEIENKKNNK